MGKKENDFLILARNVFLTKMYHSVSRVAEKSLREPETD